MAAILKMAARRGDFDRAIRLGRHRDIKSNSIKCSTYQYIYMTFAICEIINTEIKTNMATIAKMAAMRFASIYDSLCLQRHFFAVKLDAIVVDPNNQIIP